MPAAHTLQLQNVLVLTKRYRNPVIQTRRTTYFHSGVPVVTLFYWRLLLGVLEAKEMLT